jgi:acyl-CoA synthetase (AMP-forming)/AMP-acid ligase II
MTPKVAAMLLHEALNVGADRHPDRIAFSWVERGRSLSYSEALVAMEQVAGLLDALGVSSGDRVTIFANNGLDYLTAMFGCWRIGAISALVNVSYADELEYFLSDHQPSVIIYTHEHHVTVTRARVAVPSLRTLLCLDGPQDGALSWPDELARAPRPPSDPDDDRAIAHLSYTSGTSGRPKGACLAHGPTARATNCIAERLRHRGDDISFGPTALSSSYQLVANLMPTLHRGGTVCVTGRWTTEAGWQVLTHTGATILAANPVVLGGLLNEARAGRGAPSRLRFAISGGAPLSNEVKRGWRDELRIPIAESYGQSELGGFVALGLPEPVPDEELSAVGRALPDKEVRVVDANDHPMASGNVGEIVLRGGFMTGYWANPTKTADTLRGGWLHTGDLGFIDHSGLIHMRGRVSERISVAGETWYPRDLEAALESDPLVRQAAVVGVPRSDGQSLPVAFVEPSGIERPTFDSLRQRVSSQVAVSVDNLAIELFDRLPLTPTGKIAKTELREWYELKMSSDADQSRSPGR